MTQINLLNDEINELIRKRNEEEAKLQNAGSRPEYDDIQNRLATINVEIADKQALLAAAEAQESISSKFESIDLGDGVIVSLRDICTSEKWAQMLSAWIQTQIGDQAQTHATVVASYESKISAQNETISELEERVEELLEVQASASRLQMVIEDLEGKRKAAGEQLAEAKEENERLETDNKSLREQLAKRETTKTNAPTADELREMARQARAEEEAAKIPYYNSRGFEKKEPVDITAKKYRIYLAETGEPIEVPFMELGKYREVTKEEAERFRAEQAQLEAERLAQETLEQGISVPSVQFPGEEEGAIDSVDGNSPSAEVVGETVTRAEFEEVKARLARIEDRFAPTSSVA